MKPPRVRWNTTEARVERFVRLAQRLELPVYGFEVRGRDVTVLTRPREDGPAASRRRRPIPSSAGSATTPARRRRDRSAEEKAMNPVTYSLDSSAETERPCPLGNGG